MQRKYTPKRTKNEIGLAILDALASAIKPLLQSHVQLEANVKGSVFSEILDEMLEKGYVRREIDMSYLRSRFFKFSITKEGRDFLEDKGYAE